MRRVIAITLTVLGVAAACSSGTGSEQGLSRRAGGDRTAAVLGADPDPAVPPPPPPTAPSPSPAPPPPVQLAGFESCDEVLTHIRDEAGRLVTAWGLPPAGGIAVDAVAAPASGRAEAGGDGSAGGGQAAGSAPTPAAADGFSGTNLQEAGVDEPDLVKTDGNILLAVAQGRLHRIDVGPDGPTRHTEIGLPGGLPAELLLAGSRAVVFGHPDGPVATDRSTAPYPGGQTAIWVVDLSGGGGEVVASMRVDGWYVSARAVDGIARVVLSSPLRTPLFAQPDDGSPEAQQRALTHNRWAVATSTLDQWMPRYELSVAGETSTGRLCSCDELLRPTEFSGLGTLTVLTVDPADPRPDAAASVVAAGETVYASARRLYVATGRWQVAGDVAVTAGSLSTAVHAFDITDSHRAAYVASGQVPGWAVNQWAMSEHEGHLRVATTVGSGAGDPSQSLVTVLSEQGGALAPVGQVAGLGPGERIYAVRYMGATAYVVTFRQTDPLYVLDLSDAAAPRVLGELKIPGFSAYLHPVAPGHLLGVGQDATDQGTALGVQASLFDVSDPAAPRRVAQWSEGGPSHSPVEWDHRAFLHWAPRGLAVVPLESWGEPTPEGDAGGEGHRHAVVLRVDVDGAGIVEVGRISHDGRPSSGGWSAVTRSAVVGGLLYTVSDAGVLASDLASLDDRLWLAF